MSQEARPWLHSAQGLVPPRKGNSSVINVCPLSLCENTDRPIQTRCQAQQQLSNPSSELKAGAGWAVVWIWG